MTMSKITKTRDMGFRLATGVIAGAAATWAMKKVMAFVEQRENIDPQQEHAGANVKPFQEVIVDGVSDKLGVDLSPKKRQQADQALNWAMGAAGGAATAWVRKKTGAGHSLIRGALLGLGTFILFEEILKPAIGARRKPTELPWKMHARDLAGHAAYGLVNSGVRKAASRYLPI
jgi:hypothetical protein